MTQKMKAFSLARWVWAATLIGWQKYVKSMSLLVWFFLLLLFFIPLHQYKPLSSLSHIVWKQSSLPQAHFLWILSQSSRFFFSVFIKGMIEYCQDFSISLNWLFYHCPSEGKERQILAIRKTNIILMQLQSVLSLQF